MDNKKYSEVVEQLAVLRTATVWELFFNTRMEQEYQHTLAGWYRDTIRSAALIAAILLMGSHLVEWYAHAALPIGALALRWLAICSLLTTYFYARRSSTMRLQHWLVSLNGMLVVAAFLLIAQSSESPIKQIYYTNIFFVEIVVFGFIRLPLNFATTTALLMVLSVCSSLYLDQMGLRSSTYLLFLLMCGTVLCIMIAFRMEKSARESFLKGLMIQLERDQLRDLNQQMSEQFSQDRITRLQNRMTFEDTLLHACGQHSASSLRYMLLALHIEHFARFNDLMGQDRADDLLRDVARHIRATLTEVDGTGARLSGGRFVILFKFHEDQRLRACLENLRARLLAIPALALDEVADQEIHLSWGGAHMQPDAERDPRPMVDKIFRHLIPIEDLSITADQYQNLVRRSRFT